MELAHWPTRVPDFYKDDSDAEKQLARHVARTSELQDVLYASDRYSLLLIFQAMDAAGKDGAIKHVMSGVNPQGCQVSSFKQPSAEELDHDFLWRTTLAAARARPHRHLQPFVLRRGAGGARASGVPGGPAPAATSRSRDPASFWDQRMHSIRDHEAHLARNGTVIVKFFLHVSQEEQRERFLDRIDHPDKNWKFSDGDVRERQHWDQYMDAYAQALSATSTREAPWYVVPADDKKNARLIMSAVVNQTLEIARPEVSEARSRTAWRN